MSYAHHMLGMSLLSVLPVAVGQVWAASEENALSVCRQLVNEAREVNRLLRTVSDRESGASVAAELKPHMEYMRTAMERLSSLSLSSAEEMRELEQMMRDLTHLSQSYMLVVHRLAEVNAYGADELLRLFQYYKMHSHESSAVSQQTDTPLIRSYTEWCDSIDDMIYLLRRAQDAASAAAVVEELAACCRKAESKACQVENLQSGLSPQQVESERVPMERLQSLRRELRNELLRLHAADAYGAGVLREQLAHCARAARC